MDVLVGSISRGFACDHDLALGKGHSNPNVANLPHSVVSMGGLQGYRAANDSSAGPTA
jgi:hypothetical protein